MYVKRVSPEEAHAFMQDEGWAYVDVRSVPEFDQGHPAGAYNAHEPAGRARPLLGGAERRGW